MYLQEKKTIEICKNIAKVQLDIFTIKIQRLCTMKQYAIVFKMGHFSLERILNAGKSTSTAFWQV